MKRIARTRIIAFRVTQGDYDSLSALSHPGNNRVSDIARDIVLRHTRLGINRDAVITALWSLDKKLERLLSIVSGNNC